MSGVGRPWIIGAEGGRLPIVAQGAEGLGIDLAALADFASAVGPLAVVDLETTGLADDPRARIVEIGIVLIDPALGRIHTFESLVRCERPLPLAIQRLTGLSDSDLRDAPPLEALSDLVLEILEGRTIVAHNARFEQHFLSRFVSRSLGASRYCDTQDLLSLTHPDSPDLSLETFTRSLLGCEEQHRALADALDTARVLSAVATGARAGEPRYRTAGVALERFHPESPWLALLGKARDEPEASPQWIEIAETREPPVPFDEDAIAEVLADADRGGRFFPGYRVRPEQIELAREFVRAFDEGRALLLEGGTGVGKSLAYLAAAIPFAMERAAGGIREPLVISTRTRLLQDQLLRKDIAAAAGFLGYPGLRALSMKGRANYVCARRLDSALRLGDEPGLFVEDRLAHAVLLACAKTRPHGEVGALPAALPRRYPLLRDLLRRSVAARPEQCSREECAKRADCAFGRRRAALGRAQLVVANHDLLLRWPPDYPHFTHAVVDEGHELASVADEAYAQVVQPEVLFERIDDLFGPQLRPHGARASGAAGSQRHSGMLPRRLVSEVAAELAEVRRALALDLRAVGRELAERASEYAELQLPEDAADHFPDAAQLAESAAGRLERMASEALALDARQALEQEDEADGPSPVERVADELQLSASGLRAAFAPQGEGVVAGFEGLSSPYDHWVLSLRAVSPAQTFHESFMQRLESLSVVSASLFVGGDAFAALGELEIDEHSSLPVSRVSVESPFPYDRHMRVVALDSGEDLVRETADILALLARELSGRTLGLFTSLRRMRQVAEILHGELSPEGFDVLAPRRAGDDPGALVSRFCRAGAGGVLLGARTFWQGLDIPGSDLQAVVIEKLPFEVPNELRRRREDRIRREGGDAFSRFTLGKMLLHLKQMSGRLIRSEEDRGLVVIVEGRTRKGYFRRLGQALPSGIEVRAVRRDAIPAVLAEIGLPDSLTSVDPKS